MPSEFAHLEGKDATTAEREPSTAKMNDLVNAFDWAKTPLGPASAWPESLKMAVRILLTSGFQMWMGWGPELTCLYNDAYRRTTLGNKHPWALGRPVETVWPEIWKDIGPRIRHVLETGESSWEEALPLMLERNGYPEETHHTFSYSPLAGADGKIAGILCVVFEDTTRVLGERQLAALTTLSASLADAITEQMVFAAIERGLADQKDMPFALAYLLDEEAAQLKLVAHIGMEAGHPAARAEIAVGSKAAEWPMAEVLTTFRAVTLDDLPKHFANLPTGPWKQAADRARLVPITRQGQERPVGIFIAGLNPHRPFDASYAGFLDLVAGQIAASLVNARAYEEERQRAEKIARLRKEATDHEASLTREILESRQFAWEALEHIPDPFCTFDRNFCATYMNAAATTIADQTGKMHLGECLWDLYPDLKGTAVEANFRRAMDERIPVEFEQYFQNDLAESWFQFHIYPQPGEGVILYLRNTSDARRTEQALRRSEQLAAAGRLAASIAHEINNPLEAVTNLLFLAKMDETVSGNTRSLLEVADKELQRLSHIAARSLKFYRQRTAPTLISLEELIDSVLFFHEPDVKMRSIRLERRYRPAPAILCLPGEIQQVLTNLIGNALDALSEKGRLTVAVHPAKDRLGQEGVSVTIADNGSGMDRATREQLFHPFVTTKGEAGTGLGLWVSKGILEKHHSKIAVRSKRGGGTVFRLFLPVDTLTGTPVVASEAESGDRF